MPCVLSAYYGLRMERSAAYLRANESFTPTSQLVGLKLSPVIPCLATDIRKLPEMLNK